MTQEDLFSGGGGFPAPAAPLTPTTDRLLPLGKYKGQPFEVLLTDSAYAVWMLSSMYAKLEQKHPALLAFLVGRFGLPERTPVHNALQNRFLDKEFCLQFALASSPRVRDAANQLSKLKFDLAALWRKNVQDCFAAPLRLSDIYSNRTSLTRSTRRLEALRDALKTEWPLLRLYGATHDLPARGRECTTLELSGLEFEAEGADVRFRVDLGYQLLARRGDVLTEERRETATLAKLSVLRNFRIEVKPVVGDDYPMVLRRMKAANNTSLLVGEYNGVGATWEQVVQVFSLSQISVVALDEVEQLTLPQGFREFSVEPLLQAQAETIIEQEFQTHLAELRKLIEQRPEPDPRTTRWSEDGPF